MQAIHESLETVASLMGEAKRESNEKGMRWLRRIHRELTMDYLRAAGIIR